MTVLPCIGAHRSVPGATFLTFVDAYSRPDGDLLNLGQDLVPSKRTGDPWWVVLCKYEITLLGVLVFMQPDFQLLSLACSQSAIEITGKPQGGYFVSGHVAK